ncbi:hypothetical protein MXAN_4889 [Myxococcus xanthus DK 1622]|uniref:Uncharacterized protein n=1 Tax=Myxococcus xanthus (strain DK1622) TaxID=246197 RepID=Q1D2S7_MYXXD|nr:hypothetical protein MXAN_4889 [Myxococcus xanthus DK 1622]
MSGVAEVLLGVDLAILHASGLAAGASSPCSSPSFQPRAARPAALRCVLP